VSRSKPIRIDIDDTTAKLLAKYLGIERDAKKVNAMARDVRDNLLCYYGFEENIDKSHTQR
jgi:hypothetical protein